MVTGHGDKDIMTNYPSYTADLTEFKPLRLRLVGHMVRIEEERTLFRILIRQPSGRSSMG